MNFSKTKTAQQTLWLSETGQTIGLTLSHFDPDYLLENKLVHSTAEGRGTVYFFKANKNSDEIYVLRHYKRGGLVAKISDDKFLYQGSENTRSFQELKVLDYLHTQGVNVPTAIAARTHKHGLYYTADIITAAITNCTELHKQLQQGFLDNNIWREIGVQIGKMHKAGVCHDDINVKNVLIDHQQKVFLLDFDKCVIRSGNSWQTANLERFRRSINKQINLLDTYYFKDCHWQALLEGYQSMSH